MTAIFSHQFLGWETQIWLLLQCGQLDIEIVRIGPIPFRHISEATLLKESGFYPVSQGKCI